MVVKYETLAEEVVKYVGGKDNIINAWNCVTRLRFNLVDKNKVNINEIKKISGVMGAQFSGDQFQIVIGNKVGEAYQAVEDLIGSTSSSKNTVGKQSIISLIMDTLSGIFTPIIPALAGVGLLKGFISLAVILNWLVVGSDTYAILDAMGDSVFFFLPFFLAVSTARKLKTNEYLALAVAGTMMYPTILDAARGITEKTSFNFFLMNIPAINYSTSVIPMIFAVILLKYVYNFFRKYVPEAVSTMFTPLLTLIVTIPITLWLLAPLGTNVGTLMATFFTWLYSLAGPLAGALLAGLMPVIVMTGMHYAFSPIVMQNISTLNFDNMVHPAMLISNAAQGGAAFAVCLRTKNKEFRQLAFSAGLSAVFGVSEPAMYGINMRVKKPFYIAMGCSSVLGAIATFFSLKAFSLGGIIGLFSIPVFVDRNAPSSIVVALACYFAAIITPFVVTMILGFEDVENSDEDERLTETVSEQKSVILAPLDGQVVPLSLVADKVFSTGIMGKGLAINPAVGEVVAPVNGEIVVFPESKHALGIKADTGEEILIHIGIDTVSLNGKYFDSDKKVGDRIAIGDKLVSFDNDQIMASGFDTTTMIIVTNTADYSDVLEFKLEGKIQKGEDLIIVLKEKERAENE